MRLSANQYARPVVIALFASVALSAVGSTAASAQAIASGPAAAPEQADIVVTAQKREQRLQDVPAAVSVLGAAALATSNQTRLRDYFDAVPGFQVSPSPGGGNQQTLAIRGVSAGSFANPTVGVVIDEVPFGASTYDFSPEVDPSDLSRIEVLRGPQGTLYGANSMGGLVKYVTLDPSTAATGGRIEAGVNSIAHGDKLGYTLRAALNLPLSDTLALRVSGFSRKDPGYIDNPILGKKDVNDYRSSGAHVSALWKATPDFSIKLSALYQRNRAAGSPEEVQGFGLAPYQQNYILNTGQSGTTIQAYSAVLHGTIGGVDLTSVTGYSRYKTFNYQDYTNIAPWGARALALFGATGAPSQLHSGLKRVTEEVRASFKTGAMLDWQVGAFYSDEDAPIFQQLRGQNAAGTILGDTITFDIPFAYREYAVYADPTLHLTDRLSVQFGARYSWTRSQFKAVTEQGALLGGATVVLPAITRDARVFTYLVTPQYKFGRDLMIYARIASGYRPGRSNSFNTDPSVARAADADTTTNYEIGIKGDLLSRLLTFDASLYYIDWNKVQITLISASNGLAYTANAAHAKSQGAEVSLTVRPGAGLTLGGWVSLNKAVLTEGVVNAATYAPAGAMLPFSARFTANLSADKSFEISDDVQATIGATVSHVSERQGTFVATPARAVYPAYNKLDLRLGLTRGPWALNLYAKNVTDKHSLIGGGAGSFPPSAFVYIQPRNIGAAISRKF